MANMPDMAPGPHDSKPGRGELRTRVVELLKWTSPDGQSGWPAGMGPKLVLIEVVYGGMGFIQERP